MDTSPTTRSVGPARLEAIIAVAIVAADQLTKALVRARIPLHDEVPVVRGLLSIVHVQNSGAAFGILNAIDFPFKATAIALVATAAIVGIGLYAARLSPHQWSARLGLAFILGGAAGNLIDRVATGFVVDFVDVYWRDYHFWAFNVADAAITAGVAVMVIDMIGLTPDAPKTP